VRYHLVRIIVAVAMISGLLLSQKLWLTERTYPHVPVWDGLPTVPAPWDKVILGGMLFLLALSITWPWPRWPLLGFVALAGIWSLWDQIRWQPWFYQYSFMLVALGMCSHPDRRESGLNACRFILAATYIWSGLQKINFDFATSIYPWMLEPILPLAPEGMRGWLADQGWTVAFIECGLGFLLLVWPFRMAAAVALCLMHATIMYSLTPPCERVLYLPISKLGHDWNSVVWPWNIAMMILNIALFVNTKKVMPWHIVWPRRFLLTPVTLVLFAVMPFFSFYGRWDAYLSASLYSGNTIDGRIAITGESAAKLPQDVQDKHLYGDYLDLFGWSMDELNVPGYPARRIYRGIARRLSHAPGEVALEIDGSPNWRTGKKETTREKLDE
jgi:hypothetical protein